MTTLLPGGRQEPADHSEGGAGHQGPHQGPPRQPEHPGGDQEARQCGLLPAERVGAGQRQ